MARYNVNPTRIERTRQKGRLKTAYRGHKLLKDKSDEMVRTFSTLIKQNRVLRERIEKDLTAALRLFMCARGKMSTKELEDAMSFCRIVPQMTTATTNIMGLIVPKITVWTTGAEQQHTFVSTPASFDKSIRLLASLTTMLVELANIEKSCDMLADEIVKVRRRINSLEYIMIPNTQETIKYITMKLEEDQRSQQIRGMKVKEIATKNFKRN